MGTKIQVYMPYSKIEKLNWFKKHYRKNIFARLMYAELRRLMFPELVQQQNRSAYLNHRETRLSKRAIYRNNHLVQCREISQACNRRRFKIDPLYRLQVHIRQRINKALQRAAKHGRTIELLGCSIVAYKTYLESRFAIGMTWENQGFYGWTIDNIKP